MNVFNLHSSGGDCTRVQIQNPHMKVEMETKLDRDTRQEGIAWWGPDRDAVRWSILPSLSETLVFDAENPACQEAPVSGTLECLITIWVFWLQPGLSSEYSVHTLRFPVEEELLPSAEQSSTQTDSCHPRTGVCVELGHT